MHRAFAPLRGVGEHLPPNARLHRWIKDRMRGVVELAGCQEIILPILEHPSLFSRTAGEGSDIVNKEMYIIEGAEAALRPEGTAGLLRAVFNGGLMAHLPQRFWYCGSMFRHERPQKGRRREFTQFGVELLGGGDAASDDAEAIVLAYDALAALGLAGRFKMVINTLGDVAERAQYQDALAQFLRLHSDALSPDSVLRLEKGAVLRVLDSKDERDRDVLGRPGMPVLYDYLGRSAMDRFESVQKHLQGMRVPFQVDPRLVRGLDYYSHTAMECIALDGLGAQSTLLAGGCFDGLGRMLGAKGAGASASAVGWAAGIERIVLMLKGSKPRGERARPIVGVVVLRGADEEIKAANWVRAMRKAGICVVPFTHANSRRALAKASRARARVVVLIDEEGGVVRAMESGDEKRVRSVDEVIQILSA